MAQTKTDNDYLRDKVDLRIENLPDGDLRVLDCFGGRGVVWRAVKELTGRKATVTPIDIRDDIGFHLHGDNSTFLKSLDLSRYNAIDLDAYGVPADQLKILFERQYRGVVFVTFIQSVYGIMPYTLLKDLGFTEAMINKSPTLFGKRGWEYFKQWLALKGVTEIVHRSTSRKHYLSFTLSGAVQS